MKIKFKLDGETYQVESGTYESILDSVEQFGVPWSCRSGHCSSCMCKLVSGDISQDENLALTDKEIQAGFILACCCYPKSDCEIDFDIF
jgi:2Fe-2S type ferredoxin